MTEGPGEQLMVDEFGRPEPPFAGTETETLLGFLEYQRATFAWKTGGLDAAGLRVSVAASSMTLGGMIKHLAYVEDCWCHIRLFDADPPAPWDTVDWSADEDWDWHSAVDDSPEQLDASGRSRSPGRGQRSPRRWPPAGWGTWPGSGSATADHPTYAGSSPT